jgi:hypothetical protein
VSVLFDRVWRVTVEDVATSELDVRFRVTRSLASRAGTAEIEVKNFGPDHRAQVRHYRHRQPDGRVRYSRVQVEAGYRDAGLSVLFRGNARRIHSLPAPPEWTTYITAGDGEDAFRSARGARAFARDTPLEDVVRYAADAMGLGVGNVAEALAGARLDQLGSQFSGSGVVVHGRVAPQLTTLLRSAGLEWSIQNEVLQVLPRGGALARTAVVLSPDSGLVDAPEVGLNRLVTCKALIQPDLVPGGQVRLESVVVTGFYRIEQCEYSGDTRADADWTVGMVLRRIRDDGSLVGVES